MKKNVENKLIKELAKEFEFDVCKVTDSKLPLSTALRLKEFIDSGFHGEMKWMEDTFERRKSPINLWKEAKSAFFLLFFKIFNASKADNFNTRQYLRYAFT